MDAMLCSWLFCFTDLSIEGENEEQSDDDDDVGSHGSESHDEENAGSSVDDAEGSDNSNVFDDYTHKRSLERLRDTDPEFYKFLEQNDRKLLQFNVSDSENEDQDEEEDQIHKPIQDLEVS